MSVLSLLSTETQRRLAILRANPGITLSEAHTLLEGTDKHLNELNMSHKVRKGSTGVFIEQLLTGIRGDNLCEADDGIIEIKAVGLTKRSRRPSKYDLSNGYKLKEVLRLTKLNAQQIQITPFEESGLYKKSIMLVCFIEHDKSKKLPDIIIIGFGIIDLRPHADKMKIDYDLVAEHCRNGLAHTFRSSSKQLCSFAKLYSNGVGKNLATYYNKDGDKCEFKNKSFYIFKEELVDIIELL